MPPDAVLDHLVQLGETGALEVVLTGIHLGCWGCDLSPGTNLTALLKGIDGRRPVRRLRLSSIEPHEITDELIRLAAASDIICPHFHIPLQSGDDGILERMHRPYTGKLFEEIVRSIHRRMPDAAVGADVLLGFPGETDDAYRRTLALIDALPVAYLHVFPFSARPGTPAGRFSDKVQEDEIKKRCADMRKLGLEKKMAFYRRFVGKTLVILVEETRDSASGRLKGFSGNYVPVQTDGGDHLKNTLAEVRVEKIVDGRVIGTIRRSIR
jgi:threonylcarbamoyladenosine tRNA methylthiotransferase MtaB